MFIETKFGHVCIRKNFKYKLSVILYIYLTLFIANFS